MSKVTELEAKILKHKTLYYQGKPEISDYDYDRLEEELRALDPRNAVLEMVGSEALRGEKVQHARKMLSLNKTYEVDDLFKWMDGREVLSTFKIDGSSCSLIYRDGSFKLGKTRGDGQFGENISQKILRIEHIPKITSAYKMEFEVRGEIFCREEDFIKLSEEMVKRGLERPTSQRNIVAGILGRKENFDLASYLSFQAFELFADELNLTHEVEKFKLLKDMGFETPDYFLNKTKKDLEERIEEAKEFMSTGNYLIDGLVFSFNDLSLHDTLGETAHHPRFKMAFKFAGETKVTEIEKIHWQVSRNGVLTPVAQVIPVELSGAMVSRVTLHNYGMVNQAHLKKGDKIEIVRSGEVIPKFLQVVSHGPEKNYKIPSHCPSCSTELVEKDIRLFCPNEYCTDKIKEEILNFIHKIGIDDLSSKRLEELIKYEFVKKIPDLYDLTREKLLTMDKVKDKLADKIINNIEKNKKVTLPVFLSSLGISGGALNKCQKIVENGFDSIEKIKNLKIEDLMNIESFAEKSATDFYHSLQTKIPIIEKLMQKGFSIISEERIENSEISGLKFCVTGTLNMKRNELQKLIKTYGGINVSSVSSETNYLITNDEESSSSKFKKAKELKIPIIREDQFLKMIGR